MMPRGDKSKYTAKQKRQAAHIEEGYADRGVPEKDAERRAWATVNKVSGGGKTSGAGRGRKSNRSSGRTVGRKTAGSAATKVKAARPASARKAKQTRKRHATTAD
jgi:hypothetical protein